MSEPFEEISRIMRRLRWCNVIQCYLEYYDVVKEKFIEVVGGYDNIARMKEYPAEPLEMYFKICFVLKTPVKVRLVFDRRRHILHVNKTKVPLIIEELAFPLRFRYFKFGVEEKEAERVQRELEVKGESEDTIQDFFVRVDNPAVYSRFTGKIEVQPSTFAVGVYR